jgi:hypothetical protein
MIMQTIKRWLHKLFAWWPWKRSSDVPHLKATDSDYAGVNQKEMWQSAIEASISQPRITSVLSENGIGESFPEPQTFPEDELSRRISPLAMQDEQPLRAHSPSGALAKESALADYESLTLPYQCEQQLDFLRYLVQQGIVNEGFAEGQVPRQYQGKR